MYIRNMTHTATYINFLRLASAAAAPLPTTAPQDDEKHKNEPPPADNGNLNTLCFSGFRCQGGGLTAMQDLSSTLTTACWLHTRFVEATGAATKGLQQCNGNWQNGKRRRSRSRTGVVKTARGAALRGSIDFVDVQVHIRAWHDEEMRVFKLFLDL